MVGYGAGEVAPNGAETAVFGRPFTSDTNVFNKERETEFRQEEESTADAVFGKPLPEPG